ncbi:hypothetical protein DL769_010361 [Monosporascus sp. CRB-8-3]|nr:hypothetical protein DL769_010361 [Monosporascus sp. CRB-8-3]
MRRAHPVAIKPWRKLDYGPTTLVVFDKSYRQQQRRQDAAGTAVWQGGRVYQCKGNGMAAKVFDAQCARSLPQPFSEFPAQFRVRLPKCVLTARRLQIRTAFYTNPPFGLSMSVNGNLGNTDIFSAAWIVMPATMRTPTGTQNSCGVIRALGFTILLIVKRIPKHI